MKLTKVISGGQTGADLTGLECARALGLQTGGTAPKGWRTDEGPNPKLGSVYGLVEDASSDYRPRTIRNVMDAQATIWFGKVGSPGYWCTKNAAKKHEKPFYENPTGLQVRYLANLYHTWNVAGNRRSINPEVIQIVQTAFGYLTGETTSDEAGD